MRLSALFAIPVLLLGLAPRWLAAPAAADVTFARDIAPILNSKCVACHRPGEVAPMSLRTFEEVRPWARAIKEKVVNRQMPPWFADRSIGAFSNDPSLSAEEVSTIANWIDAGAPEGSLADMPAAPEFTDGWQLGEPDYVAELPEIRIPATGTDYFPRPTFRVDIPEDRWIRAVEIRPGNREVTHHAVIFSRANGIVGTAGFLDVLAVWAVGTAPTVYPDGMGRWLRRGERLIVNLHYHPNGHAAIDRPRIGFYFGRGEMKKEVSAAAAGNLSFVIPPYASHQELRAVYVVDQDIRIVSFFLHMHFRGKDMTITATLPDGRQQPLLSVPSYDFNWQLFYYPTSPIRLPRGTRVDVVAHYDNSASNRNNPDPSRTVTFGEASTDEMMFGMFEFVADEGVSPKPASDRARMDVLAATLPSESTYVVDLPLGLRRVSSVLELPRSGDGAWYLAANRQILVMPVRGLRWTGSSYEFASELRIGQFGGSFLVKGAVDADGIIHGSLELPGGARAPFSDFDGRRK